MWDLSGSELEILIINTSKDQANTRYVDSIKGKLNLSNSVISPRHLAKNPSEAEGYDGIIISGQPVYDPSHNLAKVMSRYSWIYGVDVPILGICGGHQILGLLYGARPIKGKGAERNCIYRYNATIPVDPLLEGVVTDDSFYAFSDHRDSITLPRSFSVLATSGRCKVAVMKHGKKSIYGVQFHPDNPGGLSCLEESQKILTNFENIVYQKAVLKTPLVVNKVN